MAKKKPRIPTVEGTETPEATAEAPQEPKKRTAPTKVCPACQKEVHARTGKCECGHEFERKTPKPPKTPRAVRQQPTELLATDLLELKDLVDRVGIERVKQGLEIYGKLMG